MLANNGIKMMFEHQKESTVYVQVIVRTPKEKLKFVCCISEELLFIHPLLVSIVILIKPQDGNSELNRKKVK